MNLFSKKCPTCDGTVLGPRVGGKARSQWLGYDRCEKCRATDKPTDTEKLA